MEIFGHDYGFLLSVGAEQELAALCPGGDIRRLRDLLRGEGTDPVRNVEEFLCVMSRWDERLKAFQDPGYQPQPLTKELLDLLPHETFLALQAEALRCFKRDGQTTVEAEPPKKKEDQR